jgi:hypothetical protein
MNQPLLTGFVVAQARRSGWPGRHNTAQAYAGANLSVAPALAARGAAAYAIELFSLDALVTMLSHAGHRVEFKLKKREPIAV